ncbi:YjzD family protein [Loigolactobacillus zhaoyuanensis]|uniref:YjzD family protein n=1 Tax=Loigolactobacillus zhaoyuanensis TaxID=2486017 RepID=A0ABW8UGX2_9LACO|nr:YjzD family protein [Loigolactobacillus zhaoyuanensis]
MKEIIVVIWALILGQLVGYIGSAVTSLSYSPVTVAIISAIFGLIVCILPHVLGTKTATNK